MVLAATDTFMVGLACLIVGFFLGVLYITQMQERDKRQDEKLRNAPRIEAMKRDVLRKHGVDPDSPEGQELLRPKKRWRFGEPR